VGLYEEVWQKELGTKLNKEERTLINNSRTLIIWTRKMS